MLGGGTDETKIRNILGYNYDYIGRLYRRPSN